MQRGITSLPVPRPRALVLVNATALALCGALLGCAGRFVGREGLPEYELPRSSKPPCPTEEPACKLPRDLGSAVVLVLSGPLMAPVNLLARHAWFVVRDAGEQDWERWEIWRKGEGADRWGYVGRNIQGPWTWYAAPDRVVLHGALRGPQASAFIDCLRSESPRYEHRDFYVIWPGPNSNTYIDVMLHRCGMPVDLPPTAIGKDWRGVIGASPTTRGTGVQFETPVAGFKLGLAEGIEIHLLTLTFGVDFWPPALKVPFGTGRIGFADD